MSPYIPDEERGKDLDSIADCIALYLEQAILSHKFGKVNYILSKAIWQVFDLYPGYDNGRELESVFRDIIHEFNRRRRDIYEDEKIEENGDIL